MSDILIHQLPAFDDNYLYVLHDKQSGTVAAIDPGSFEVIDEFLTHNQLNLSLILCTHQHSDHIGGVEKLRSKYDCKVISSLYDRNRIPCVSETVQEGDFVMLGRHRITVMDVPGHTNGHVAYYFEKQNLLFCGDTLFAMGCGRLFEGSPSQMWKSLQKIANLPANTTVYCAHEYTVANGEFSLSIDPENSELISRVEDVKAMRAAKNPTVPFELKMELTTNPFLRAGNDYFLKKFGTENPSESFTQIRKLKDQF